MISISYKFPVIMMLLAQGPHFENHWYMSIHLNKPHPKKFCKVILILGTKVLLLDIGCSGHCQKPKRLSQYTVCSASCISGQHRSYPGDSCAYSSLTCSALVHLSKPRLPLEIQIPTWLPLTIFNKIQNVSICITCCET